MPPKLSARVLVFVIGDRRETGPVDAHSVAHVALRRPGPGAGRGEPSGDGILADRCDELGRARTKVIHRSLLELLPGGAKKFLPACRRGRTYCQRKRRTRITGYSVLS